LKIDIYTTIADGNKYLSLPVGTKLEDLSLPTKVDADVLHLSSFKTRLEITEAKAHNALDSKDIIQQIKDKGFAIHTSTHTIKLSQND